MTKESKEERVAHELIDLVEKRMAPRAALLQMRIDNAVSYMDGVTQPSTISLNAIRRYLTGWYE